MANYALLTWDKRHCMG